MILTPAELASLSELRHASPHSLLGMHALDGRKGLVVRAQVPDAVRIELVPTHESHRPHFLLSRLGDTTVFEGTTDLATEIYAYDLVITDHAGQRRQQRDAYSFLPTLGETDLYLIGEGKHRKLYDVLGAQPRTVDGVRGTSFAVWAPNARRVSVVGSWNRWDGRAHPMRLLGTTGVWEIFIPGVEIGSLYKFELTDSEGRPRLKTDPFGLFFEQPPKNAAIVWDTRRFQWDDAAWLKRRSETQWLRAPMSIYELHLGSWRKRSAFESWSYRDLAQPLIDYLRRMAFTHVEFLPVSEHAFYPSWGYQVTGFFAPTSRFGTPDDLQYLIQSLHEAGIGVLIDWVPGHFPKDDWSLARFDGTALYEHADPRQGSQPDWGTLVFNYGRNEVRNFLTANALYWADRFHVDGLRVDAVASMLYLDYSRKEGEWVPNQYGGRENLEAVAFLRQFNELTHTEFPGILTIAEESTAWPMVSRPPWLGGLGFDFKWNMGWMHDTLGYFKRDPIYRKYHQNDLTFAMLYHLQENYILPLSHDEVVHGKGSLRKRMPGDDWRSFANLRALLGYQWMFPGKKLLFMGGEFGQVAEWNENASLDWWLLGQGPYHQGLQDWVADLNSLYQSEPALSRSDYEAEGFWWMDCGDHEHSVLSFVRQSPTRDSGDGISARPAPLVLVILNLTPDVRRNYRIGLPKPGQWTEALNSDSQRYGGGNLGNAGAVTAEEYSVHGQRWSALFTLPPLSILVFRAS
jgi:1,4-alpha-glucan branching enzyme